MDIKKKMQKFKESTDMRNEIVNIGSQLRTVRIQKGMTLKAIATKAQLSESFLSQLERGLVNASVASIQRVAIALDTTVNELFEGASGKGVKVIRKMDRPKLLHGIMGRKSMLTPNHFKNFEVYIGEFDEGGSTGKLPYYHGDSEEMLFILSGSFEVTIGNEIFELAQGDCVNYRSSIPHKVKSIGEEGGNVMWIISPPSI